MKFEKVNPKKTALILIDIQNDFFSNKGIYKKYATDLSVMEKIMPNVKKLIEKAKKVGVITIFVKSYFDNKYKFVPLLEKHKLLGINDEICKEGSWGAEFYEIKPEFNNPVIIKHTNDAFMYTFLEPLLRKHNITTVILTGALTETCVETTARSAQLRGYFVVVPKDCTSSDKKICYDTSLKTMQDMFIDVVDSNEITEAWNSFK